MPTVFSFTAPFIDAKQEQQERDALSVDERQKIHDDIYGLHNDYDETEAMVSNAAGLVREAIAQIPDTDKADYLTALELAPELVERECNPLAFMRCEEYSAPAAARRIVDYWKMRRTLFGEEKALLSMTLGGAMAGELEYLQRGVIQILPNDAKGRPVVFWDRIRSKSSVIPRDSVLRILFYILHVMCESEEASRKGFVIGLYLKGYDIYAHFDRALTKKTSVLIRDCLPAKVRAVHWCSGPGQSVLCLVLPVIKQIVGRELRMRYVLHAESEKETLERLKLYGLLQHDLSHLIGGGVTHSDYSNWLAERHAIEEERSLHDP